MPAVRARKGSRIVHHLKRAIVFAVFVLTAVAGSVASASAQQRLALVIGQSAYDGRQLATAANDAGLIAQTLTSAGFEVIQGRDLNANDLRGVVRDFLDKAQELGNDDAVMVYLSGYGLQLEGENYFLPVDARIQRDVDIPIDGFRLSDLVRSLERIPARTRIVVADMARDYPLPAGSDPIARGLALMEPPAGFLIAFSSAPGITTGDAPGPYGHYATALAETIRQPGVPVNEVFNRVRLRTHETTQGLQTPWDMANLGDTPFVFFETEETASAPPPVREVRRIEDSSAEDAYSIAVERDTIQDYQAFLRRYPDHPLARRVTALLAARREAIVWRRTVTRNTSEAYWTYLRRYPNGPHAGDSRRRLARLSAPVAPPSVFEEVVYDDLPPPLPVVERVEVVEVVTIIREAPPPPPPPVYFRSYYDEDVEFVTIIREPPPPPILVGVLPVPAPIPVPRRARPPRSFYQPIAPVTPRGPVAIPVAPPPIAGPVMGRPGTPRPQRGARPEPVVPRQPGLIAQPQPIPVAARPAAPRVPGARDLSGASSRPRLPSRPIPVPTAARQEVDRPAPLAPRPAVPVPGSLRRLDPSDNDRQERAVPRPTLPAAPRPAPSAREAAPDASPRVPRSRIEQDRPAAARQPRLEPERERPAAPRLQRPRLEDNRQDNARPARPAVRLEEPARAPRPAVQPRPEPRLEAPRPRMQQVRPEPEPREIRREIRPPQPMAQPRPAPIERPRPQLREAPVARPQAPRMPSAREEVRRPAAPAPNRQACRPPRPCQED